MSSKLQRDSDVSRDDDLYRALKSAKVERIDSTKQLSNISLQDLAVRITAQLKPGAGELASICKKRLDYRSRSELQTQLHALNEQLVKAHEELVELQTPQSETSDHLHLRVLKELAAQQQQQLLQSRQWQEQVAQILQLEGENSPATAVDLKALAAQLQGRIDLQSTLESAAEDAQKRLTFVKGELDEARRAEDQARADLIKKDADLKKSQEQQLLGQEHLVKQEQRLKDSDVEKRGSEQQLHQLKTSLESLTSEREQQAGELQKLRDEMKQWQLGFDQALNDRLEQELLSRPLPDARAEGSAGNLARAPRIDEKLQRENQQLREQLDKGRALWMQSGQRLEDYKRQLAHLEREKTSAHHRAGLMQSRLEDHFKANQQLKKQLIGLQQRAGGEQATLQELGDEVKALREDKEAWTLQRLELQKQLVDQAQERSDAKQEVGRLESKERELQSLARELSGKSAEQADLIERLKEQVANEQQNLQSLQERTERELAEHRLLGEAAKSASAEKSAEQLQEQGAQLVALQRQNGELQLQLRQALDVIDEQRTKQGDLVQSGQQTQKMVQQLVEQLREKDARAQLLQRQLHKRGMQTQQSQEQLAKSEAEIARLRNQALGQSSAEQSLQQLKQHAAEQSKQIDSLTASLRRAETRAQQLENLERSYKQLQQLLTPLRTALLPIEEPKHETREQAIETNDLFQPQAEGAKMKAHLFERLDPMS